MGATIFAARAPWGASSAGDAALCLLPAAPWALGHTQPRMSPYRPTFDQPSRHPGKAGKGPLPKLPGRVLYRAAADRRNTTRATIRESSRHSYRAGSAHPGLAPAMCPVPVPVLCRIPDRRLGLSWPVSVICPSNEAHSVAGRTSTALPARALFITRGAFRRLIAAGAPTV